MTNFDGIGNYEYAHIGRYWNGWKKPKLRSGQVSLYRPDTRPALEIEHKMGVRAPKTEIYDLSDFGLGLGDLDDWKVWAAGVFNCDIAGDYPNFYIVEHHHRNESDYPNFYL